MPHYRGRGGDQSDNRTQTKREIWLLTMGTIIVEIPVAFAAFTIWSH